MRRFKLFVAFGLLLTLTIMSMMTARDTVVAASNAPSTSSGLFKVAVIQSEGPPIGCVGSGCPSIDRKIAAFEQQPLFPELGTATKIQVNSYAGPGSQSGSCAIVSGGLKCWGGNRYGQLGDETTNDSPTALVTATELGTPLTGITDVSVSGSATCIVGAGGVVKCVGQGFGTETYAGSGGAPASSYGRTWVTVMASGASRVWTNPSETCVIKTDETYWCAPPSMTPTWTDSGLTGIKDAATCLAGKISYCKSFGMSGGTWNKVLNADNAEAVYYQANAICFYRLGSLWCASQSGGGTMTARLIGMMPKPLGVINMAVDVTSTQMFFLLPTGIITALTSMISCDNCYTSSTGVISKLSAFGSSTSTSFNNVVSINGSTNSLDYIPATVVTGSRSIRSVVPVTVKTQSGEVLAGASVRWNAPDAPGTVSSGSNPITTDANGEARVTVASGPVAFTVQGGSTKSGATLQAATVTTMVDSSGPIVVTIPDPPEVVDRKVSVVMSDGTPVPNAAITVRNSYLAYSYRFVDTDVATWGAQRADSKGYFGTVMCSWCFVPPPAYITGADGTITFKTFNTGARSTDRDVDVSYDDEVIVQTLKHDFGTTNDVVTMTAMARTKASVVDSTPATSSIDVPVESSGSVAIEIAATAASNDPMTGLSARVEEVCSGMDTGGLWKSGLKLDNICTDVSGTTVTTSSVSKFATCTSSTTVTTGADGKTKITLCPTKSTRYRLRGKGAVATLSFCVVVAGQPCGTSTNGATSTIGTSPTASTPAGTTVATPTKKIARSRTVPLRSLIRPTAGSKFSYRTTGACRIVGGNLRTPSKKTSCRLTLTQTKKGARTTRTIVVTVA